MVKYNGNNKKKKDDLIREQPLTYEDYFALPDEEGVRSELVDGKLEFLAGVSPKHQSFNFQMTRLLLQTCEMEYIILQDVDIILSRHEVRRPDIVVVHRNRKSIITKRGIDGAPDLVVEVLSPHSIKRDKVGKLASYARHRIKEYWIVDPINAYLEQYTLNGSSYELRKLYTEDEGIESEHLPCVAFTMQEIMSKVEDLPYS